MVYDKHFFEMESLESSAHAPHSALLGALCTMKSTLSHRALYHLSGFD